MSPKGQFLHMHVWKLSSLVCFLVETTELYVVFYKNYLYITNVPEYWYKTK